MLAIWNFSDFALVLSCLFDLSSDFRALFPLRADGNSKWQAKPGEDKLQRKF